MKKTNRFIAMAAALTLTASSMIPMFAFADGETPTASITITGVSSTVNHTFDLYQVFTGDYDSIEGVLSNIKWGTGVSKYGTDTVTPGADVAATVVTAVSDADAEDIPALFTLSANKASVTSSGGTAEFTGLTPGYYIVKDVTSIAAADDARSTWILQVADTSQITIKNAKPTVDKQVSDEDDTATTATTVWGETADHAINEQFKFKLKATIPADADLKSYTTYKLVFNDAMSAGVTFDEIESVTVADTTLDASEYTASAVSNDNKWTLTISDIVESAGTSWGAEEFNVEVTYKAHLNEDAFVDAASRSAAGTTANTNYNSVYLQYSNNPYYDGTGTGGTGGEGGEGGTGGTGEGETFGQTPTDYVWVFTYEVKNTKYADSIADANKLAGAKFMLYAGDQTSSTTGFTNPIEVIYDSTRGAYRPIKSTETGAEMESSSTDATKGEFNIIGLDAGVYTLVETVAPSGYNKCAPTKLTINAAHAETTDGTGATLDLKDAETSSPKSTLDNDIIDAKGSALPETGGIGTTLFYIGGGCMVGIAGILLITKKRTKNANN